MAIVCIPETNLPTVLCCKVYDGKKKADYLNKKPNYQNTCLQWLLVAEAYYETKENLKNQHYALDQSYTLFQFCTQKSCCQNPNILVFGWLVVVNIQSSHFKYEYSVLVTNI